MMLLKAAESRGIPAIGHGPDIFALAIAPGGITT
jgi:hypothetical protein